MKRLLKIRFLILLVFLFSGAFHPLAQDIQTIGQSKPITLRGYMSTGTQYLLDDNPNFQNPNPFGLFLSAGLTVSLFNTVDIPISVTLSNQQLNFNRPNLQLYGLSPTYKWITVHGGYRAYSLSPYIMAGRYVLGGGIELRPGKFHILVFYGNLLQDFNFTWFNERQSENRIEQYSRRTLGGSIGIGQGRSRFEIQFLRSIDDTFSPDQLFMDSIGLYPGANFAVGLVGSMALGKHVRVGGNLASSAVNYNLRAEELSESDRESFWFGFASGLMPINTSVRWTFAYDAYTEFMIKQSTLRLKFQHIDPEYTTFGVQFLPSNLRNYLTEVNTSLLKGKLNINASFGIQTTNTQNQFAGNERRTIVNGFASYSPDPKWNFSGSYNNFNSNGNLSVVEFIDTLSLSNTSESYSASVGHSFGDAEKRHNIAFSGSLNRFVLIQGFNITNESESSSMNGSYNIFMQESGWGIGGNVLFSSFGGGEQNTVTRYGLGSNISKRFGKRINFSFGPSFNLNFTGGVRDGFVTSIRGGFNYQVYKNNNLFFNINYINRQTQLLGDFNQLRVALNYSTSF